MDTRHHLDHIFVRDRDRIGDVPAGDGAKDERDQQGLRSSAW